MHISNVRQEIKRSGREFIDESAMHVSSCSSGDQGVYTPIYLLQVILRGLSMSQCTYRVFHLKSRSLDYYYLLPASSHIQGIIDESVYLSIFRLEIKRSGLYYPASSHKQEIISESAVHVSNVRLEIERSGQWTGGK